MRRIWFEYWGAMVEVKEVKRIPRKGRYLCSDLDEGLDYYDVDEDFIIAVRN